MMAYSDQDWVNVADNMEKSVSEFLVEEERCRADCEDNVDFEDSAHGHFTGLIAGK
jgi:hypothetical protein